MRDRTAPESVEFIDLEPDSGPGGGQDWREDGDRDRRQPSGPYFDRHDRVTRRVLAGALVVALVAGALLFAALRTAPRIRTSVNTGIRVIAPAGGDAMGCWDSRDCAQRDYADGRAAISQFLPDLNVVYAREIYDVANRKVYRIDILAVNPTRAASLWITAQCVDSDSTLVTATGGDDDIIEASGDGWQLQSWKVRPHGPGCTTTASATESAVESSRPLQKRLDDLDAVLSDPRLQIES